MTALAVPAQSEEDTRLRPLPWRRMAWVTWRQHRTTLMAVAAFLGGLAVLMWLAGLKTHHVYAALVAACHPASSVGCAAMSTTFIGTNGFLSNGFILQGLPALIGAFAGAPVLARELESGTFRYAWTQGFGRWRWALAKVVLLALVMTAAAELFSLLLSWYYQPYFTVGNQVMGLEQVSPFTPGLFDLRGVAFAAWTLTAFAIGVLVGTLLRRVVPAIAVTLAAYAGLAFATGGLLRQHYLAPLLTSSPDVPGSSWITSQWWTKNGTFAFRGWPSDGVLQQYCSNLPGGSGPGGKVGPEVLVQCLSRHGFTQWTSYQPVSRFWPFQGIEGGWLLLLSVLLLALTVVLIRRRAA